MKKLQRLVFLKILTALKDFLSFMIQLIVMIAIIEAKRSAIKILVVKAKGRNKTKVKVIFCKLFISLKT